MSADIDALYKKAQAVLWVEDSETRAWLDSVWLGLAPTIMLRVAGGHPNVSAVCAQAVDAGWRHVFGLVDQDFGSSNRHRWFSLSLEERVYRLDVHETENLLIDHIALEGCTLNRAQRSAADIEAHLISAAQRRRWWVACARFLSDTQRSAVRGFPRVPSSVTSLAEAEAHILGSDWFMTTAAACSALVDPVSVNTSLQAAHGEATNAITDGTWLKSFPGKQLFREISGYLQPSVPGASAHIDLVKSVGNWQRMNSAPPQVSELRQSILARI